MALTSLSHHVIEIKETSGSPDVSTFKYYGFNLNAVNP
mgnify:CR=1 FL=1